MHVTAAETPYFYRKEGRLHQAVDIFIDSLDGPDNIEVKIAAGGVCSSYTYDEKTKAREN